MKASMDLPVVEHRRKSRLPLEIPMLPHMEQPFPADIAQLLKGTTAMGLELIRRRVYQIKKRMRAAGVQLKPSESGSGWSTVVTER